MPVRTYVLYVKLGGAWQVVCRIDAESHADALQAAAACLRPEHERRPVRLELQEADSDTHIVH